MVGPDATEVQRDADGNNAQQVDQDRGARLNEDDVLAARPDLHEKLDGELGLRGLLGVIGYGVQPTTARQQQETYPPQG